MIQSNILKYPVLVLSVMMLLFCPVLFVSGVIWHYL